MAVAVKQLLPEDIHARAVEQLGLAQWPVDLEAPEAVAAALRRAAGFLCPCAPATLVRAVVRPLEGLCADLSAVQTTTERILDCMVSHGDLLEGTAESIEVGARGMLYAAPPAFVLRRSGGIVLLGIAPDQPSPLPRELDAHVSPVEHLRRLPPGVLPDAATVLRELGLIELSYERWLGQPAPETPDHYVRRFDAAVSAVRESSTIPGLVILDAARPVMRYRDRWTTPKAESGCFVGRRAQAYGADLWCYVQLRDGAPSRFVDLPLRPGRDRACDEAWRLQLAIDASRGVPQRYRVRRLDRGGTIELFSPVPAWASRRWDAVGEPCRSSGALFAYRFADDELAEETRFAREMLWLSPHEETR